MNSQLSKIKKENIINEYKGNIFEYLVSYNLAKFYSLEKQFIETLDYNYRKILCRYESFIRSNDIYLIRSLPALATETSNEIINKLIVNKIKIDQVLLVGKMQGLARNPQYYEADIFLKNISEDILISLKLCKFKSFVNTKNAGAQSFIEKYFPFPDSFKYQEELNHKLTVSFRNMSGQLHKIANLPPSPNFLKEWTSAGYSELPGELPKNMQNIIYQHYYEIISHIYEIFRRFISEDRALFAKSLMPLCGISNHNIVQVSCFYNKKNESTYLLKGIHILNFYDLKKELDLIKIKKLKKGLSSFEIDLNNITLQIRVKPMNKFTVPGLKINCSVKFNI